MFKKFVLVSNLFLIIIFHFELLAYNSISLDKLPENSIAFIEKNFNNTNIKTDRKSTRLNSSHH